MKPFLHKGSLDHDHEPQGGGGLRAGTKGAATGVASASNRPLLVRDSGQGQILFFDAQSGIAGDMTIAALLDLGVPSSVVEECVAQLGLHGVQISAVRRHIGAIGATAFEVQVSGAQPERGFSEIEALIQKSALKGEVKTLAIKIFSRLAQAEAEVHRVSIDEVHFHEVGAVDAIVDIVGAAACLNYLGARVLASPLPLGRGTVQTRHGALPLPAPATVLCLRGVPTYAANIEAELVTPTGAAIIATVAEGYCDWPEFAPQLVGYGRGSRELPDRLNALRAVLGPAQGSLPGELGSHRVVEANVDDISGELAAHVLAQLLQAGALDAWAVATIMKKGRPGLLLCAIAETSKADAIARVLLTESTTIGVRQYAVNRCERPRRVITVQTAYGEVPVKVSEGDFGPAQYKPEFDRCVELARKVNVPVRLVLAAALEAIGQMSGR